MGFVHGEGTDGGGACSAVQNCKNFFETKGDGLSGANIDEGVVGCGVSFDGYLVVGEE